MVVRSTDQIGVLRITVQSASGLKAGSQGTSDPYTELYLGEHHFHKTSTLSGTCDPVWNETFEYHGLLKDLIGFPLEAKVREETVVPAGALQLEPGDLGAVAFDLTELAKHDFVSSRQLSGQGSLSLKVCWAPAKVLRTGEMFVKFKPRQLYNRHQFTLSVAQNLNEAGLKEVGTDGQWHTASEWKSYRLAYLGKNGAEVGYTIIGLVAETLSRQEFSISTLDATMANPCLLSMRVEASKDYGEWTDLLKKVEDPKLTINCSPMAAGLSSAPSFGIIRRKSSSSTKSP